MVAIRIVIAGGHGKIGLRPARLLGAREAHPTGLIRRPEQAADLVAVGAHPVVFDLEAGSAPDLASIVRGADAVVFAAGAGPGSGAPRQGRHEPVRRCSRRRASRPGSGAT